MATNFDFNGLIDSALPNVYINRVTLEQTNFKPVNKNKNLSAYIDEEKAPHIASTATVQVSGDTTDNTTGDGVITDNSGNGVKIISEMPTLTAVSLLTPPNKPFEEELKINFDLFLNLPDISAGEFFKFIFDQGFAKYMSFTQFVFSGKEGRKLYTDLLYSYDNFKQFLNAFQSWESNAGFGLAGSLEVPFINALKKNNVTLGEGFSYEVKTLNDILVDPNLFGGYDPTSVVDLRDNYKTTLPDGTVVFKLPIKTAFSIPNINPTDLATMVFCTINMTEVLNEMSTTIGSMPEFFGDTIGRLTSEVVIKNSSLQKKGMIFSVSHNQETPELTKIFGNMAGQVWLGAVHRAMLEDNRMRYMAGNKHMDDPHPYLDVMMVDNFKVQDFRQIARFDKQLFDFSRIDNKIFGGAYKKPPSGENDLIFENLPLFTPLVSSKTSEQQVSLFFGMDFGKVIKRHAALPRLLDRIASSPGGNTKLVEMLTKASLISLQIYRRRTDVPETTINPYSNRKLIYSTGQHLKTYYTDKNNGKTYSSLVPIQLSKNNTNLSGFYKFYSMTDYDIASLEKGKFEYSLEFKYHDPTLMLLGEYYAKNQSVVNALTPIIKMVTTTRPSKNTNTPKIFNPYTGKFSETFIKTHTNAYADGIPPVVQTILNEGTIVDLLNIMRDDAFKTSKEDFNQTIKNMLNPIVTTPDSMVACLNIFKTIGEQLRQLINSFATAKIPKNATGTSGGTVDTIVSPTSKGSTKKLITVTHTFGQSVNNTQMDAGYDFFKGYSNQSQNKVGLKMISKSSYIQRVKGESANYFKTGTSTPTVFGAAAGDDFSFDVWPPKTTPIPSLVGDKFQAQSTISATEASYLTVPFGGVKLPAYIEEQMLGNESGWDEKLLNIIRYKNGLAGDYDRQEKSFTDPRLKDHPRETEQVLKSLQLLNVLGASFKEITSVSTKASPPAQLDSIDGIIGGAIGRTPSNQGTRTTVPSVSRISSPVNVSDPVGGGMSTPNMVSLLDALEINKVPDLKLRNLLLSLINMTLFNLGIDDLSLKSYDPSQSSKITEYYKPFYKKWIEGMTNLPMAPTLENYPPPIGPLNNLPNQFKALMLANTAPFKLNTGTQYLNKEVPTAICDPESAMLFLGKYGDFWFKHQNIVEVQYLSGFESFNISSVVQNVFEEVYSQAASSPVWETLTTEVLNTFSTEKEALLCRIKKYNNSTLINEKVSRLLELPYYDEHFLMYVSPPQETTLPFVPQSNTSVSTAIYPDSNVQTTVSIDTLALPQFQQILAIEQGEPTYGITTEEDKINIPISAETVAAIGMMAEQSGEAGASPVTIQIPLSNFQNQAGNAQDRPGKKSGGEDLP